VLSSSIDPMPEFGGDAVIYFDPRTPADLAAKLATLLANPEQQHDYAQRATARSQCYDWRVTTHRTWHALCALHETTRPQ
ncbi:MAG: hypothetical protein Q7R45_10545, partial [Sulfuricaulis sp.]|nr:hypothetical protein [Sulfuricaulis sp.]